MAEINDYLSHLPKELLYTIIDYIKIKKDLDKLFKSL